MKPVKFEGWNRELTKPQGMTDKECFSLPVYCDGKQVISCWELSEDEKKQIAETGKVWLSVWSGRTAPPVCLSTDPLVIPVPYTPARDPRDN